MYQPLGQPFNPHMQNYLPQPIWQPQYSPSTNPGENLSSKLRLPKLELKSFDGNMMNWMEFWDSFERNIHLNSSLCDVDKMSYLKASLKGTASHAIADLRTTGDNYAPAVDILKEKYGKANVLKGSHMSALKAVVGVTYSKNVDGLKKLYEIVDMHVKALSVLGTSEEQYSLVIVPDLMKKIPRDVELSIRRTMPVDHEWTMSEFLNKLREELLFRGMDEAIPRVQSSREEKNPNKGKAFAISPNASCAFCLGDHSSADCSVVTEVKKKKSILMRYKRCFCCLKKGHRVKECYNKKPCSKCNEGEHHPVICEKEESSVPNMHVVTPGGIAYQTVLAKVNVKGKPSITCRCLLDTGCDKTYMLQKTANLLKSKPLRQDKKVLDTVHGERQHICSVYKIEVKDMKGRLKFETEVSTLSKLTSVKNVKPQILKEKFNHLKNLEFSDISSDKELEIDVIIGLEDLCKLKTGNMKWGNAGDPVAEETTLGWTLMGPTNTSEDQSISSSVLLTTDKENLSNQIAKLWDLETVGIREENSVEEKFEDTVSFNGERYSVQLPWKSDRVNLQTNRSLCERRLNSQLKRLKKEPEILKKYDDVIKDQIKQGIIEEVPDLPTGERIHFLPHHPVIRENAESTKVRVVYDGSAKERKGDKSLNECLYTGPSLLPMLHDVLLRFRMFPVALVGDIKSAFHQILVDEKDRDSMRFLWVENVADEKPVVKEYRFTRVIFGSGPSPYLLNATLQRHLKRYEEQEPAVVQNVLPNMYCDDLVSGAANSTQAIELKDKITEIMQEGGFQLHKWKTNNLEVREHIMEQSDQKDSTAMTYAKESLGTKDSQSKVLGLKWDPEEDILGINMEAVSDVKTHKVTKREVLSTLSKVYDPLGIVGPVTVIAKLIFQDICKENKDWDKPVSPEIEMRWKKWMQAVSRLTDLEIPRCIMPASGGPCKISLHVFGDASKVAYCAAVYLAWHNDNQSGAHLVTAKTRLPPIKKEMTIPRLELTAARIAARLLKTVRETLKNWEPEELVLWSDSSTVLHWLENRGQYRQFVQRRVDEIQELTKDVKLKYVPTAENPADLGTRGLSPQQLEQNKLWWNGPEFLVSGNYPHQPQMIETEESKAEERQSVLPIAEEEPSLSVDNVVPAANYSSYGKLLRVTALVLRFIRCLKKKMQPGTQLLHVEEIQKAEELWIKDTQTMLKGRKSYPQIKAQLAVIEINGILHCQGRLQNTALPDESKFPMLLPQDSRFTSLLIAECHKRTRHGGVNITLAEVRSKFWVLKGRQAVKQQLRQCMICSKRNAKPCAPPQSGQLPTERVVQGNPFSTTGVDFAGPIHLKNEEKAYVALFTCGITRAVHLELTEDMTAHEFMGMFRRFISRRGAPSTVISDNAKTFLATAKHLKKICAERELQDFLLANRIDWHFNVAKAPWQGGFFERLVGITKTALFKTMGKSKLTFRELENILIEVEGRINNRPLTYQTADLEEEPLTPNHMIHGHRLTMIGDVKHDNDADFDDKNVNKRMQFLRAKLEHVWNRWSKEYLVGLREYHRTTKGGEALPELGTLVLIIDTTIERRFWKLAKISSYIKGRDHVVRAVKLDAVSQGRKIVMERPLQGICPLEIKAQVGGQHIQQERVQEKEVRPRRVAAFAADELLKVHSEVLNQE